MVSQSTYRAVADEIGIDVGYLHRIIGGARKITREVALFAGYTPIPAEEIKQWVRSEKKHPDYKRQASTRKNDLGRLRQRQIKKAGR